MCLKGVNGVKLCLTEHDGLWFGSKNGSAEVLPCAHFALPLHNMHNKSSILHIWKVKLFWVEWYIHCNIWLFINWLIISNTEAEYLTFRGKNLPGLSAMMSYEEHASISQKLSFAFYLYVFK